jgi:radical SAM superfamily enzyme YgiQ (UPF0313 family)
MTTVASTAPAPRPADNRSRVLLISTYELGHQPFGLASPAAWLRAADHVVTCVDLAVDTLPDDEVTQASLIGIYVPMHTATRLAIGVFARVRALNPTAHICAYGLYAPANEQLLRSLGAATVIGGEFEQALVALADTLSDPDARPDPGETPRQRLPLISLERQRFLTPDRDGLPDLSRYAMLRLPDGEQRIVAYTEATRGCKHLCRHCPVVPVYGGRFRVVQRDVVLDDIARQVALGAQHVTFGDPDFFNGPGHAVAVVRDLHERFPEVSYDVVVKIQHLVDHADLLPVLRETGCLLVTSAVEAFDEYILEVFDKKHTRADFAKAVELLRDAGIAFNPTFVAFTPWTTAESYVDFLVTIADLGLIGNVAPVQYAIRLLIPEGSLLLRWPDIESHLDGFDPEALCYRWTHPDPTVDRLQEAIFELVERESSSGRPRAEVFAEVCRVTSEIVGPAGARLADISIVDGEPIAQLTEPWFCCAEPVRGQLQLDAL